MAWSALDGGPADNRISALLTAPTGDALERPNMDRRFVLFFVLAVVLTFGYSYVLHVVNPPPPHRVAASKPENEQKPAGDKKPAPADQPKPAVASTATTQPAPPAAGKATPAKTAATPSAAEKTIEPAVPEQWATLGSLDPGGPYRMLVTFTNRGAAVVRIELNGPQFRDLDDRGAYLGHLVMEKNFLDTVCRVDLVGPGSPADKAGLRPGDVIAQVNGTAVRNGLGLMQALRGIRPGRKITLDILRDGKHELLKDVELGRRPLELTRPEADDPLSFLLTLSQIGDEKLGEAEKKQIDPTREFPGVNLRTGTWKMEQGDDRVVFRRTLSKWNLEVTKTYRLAKESAAKPADRERPAYHLMLEVGVRNLGGAAQRVAYQLDGPTGLPTEGYWYASKAAGDFRDCVVSFNGQKASRVGSTAIADDKIPAPWEGELVSYIGVDAQYFAVTMAPQHDDPLKPLIARSQPIRVGKVNDEWKKLVDVSCRVTSHPIALEPNAQFSHAYEVFAGPKRPDLVEAYQLTGLLDYGWLDFIVVPMLKALHAFYAVVRNYGLAIIMLTVLVRLCLFPLSRKQALGAQKMAEIQPELKKIQEKHKKDPESLRKAQMELFRKHNYHPLSGCLPIFIQLPIFIGLYRSLTVDVELRQAPLISESIRWCSNLAAPDMLFDWSGFMPHMITSGVGLFGLGPYFNLLPILTIVLFLWQQKMMMPPPADEQAAMQQKVMKYMMVFMGLMFFKVASGLCIYFIASSLWGVAERKFLPKMQTHGAGGPTPAAISTRSSDNPQRNRNRNRK